MSELRHAEVDHRGLLKVLGENLYSDPEIVVRELVQNAHDSVTRRRLESQDDDVEPTIQVVADPATATLRVVDNGAGLTLDEIHAYLATIGAGTTRLLRANTPGTAQVPSLIGAFGLGFLSTYVVADRVDVVTTSFREPGQSWRFSSRDGLRYTVTEAPSTAVGTEVVLHLSKMHRALADPTHVRTLLHRYARMLPHPVHAPDRVNPPDIPWRDADVVRPALRQKSLLALARQLEPVFEPVIAFDVSPTDAIGVHGALWVHDGGRWSTSDNRRVSLYVRGMFVSDEVRSVLPVWAGFVGGALECDALTPTASREDVQRDEVFRRLQHRVAEVLVAELCALVTHQPEAWRRVLHRHGDALRGAALADERLFGALGDCVPIPTSEGDLTLPEIDTSGPLHATVGDEGSYEAVLHRALGKPVIDGTRFGALALAQRWADSRGRPVVVLGTEQGNQQLFPSTPVEPAIQRKLESWWGTEEVAVVPTRFEPPWIPVLLVPDRDALLKRAIEDDEADKRMSHGVLGLARLYTADIDGDFVARLFVNLDAPVVSRLLQAPDCVAAPVAAVLQAFAEASGQRANEGFRRDLGTSLQELSGALSALMPSP